MVEIALGGGAREIDRRRLAAAFLEGGARLPRRGVLGLEAAAQVEDLLVGRTDVLPQGGQLHDLAVELPLRLGHRGDQRFPRGGDPRVLGAALLDPLLELAVGSLDARDAGLERGGPLDERRVPGLHLGHLAPQALDRLPPVEHPALRRGQPLVGDALLALEPLYGGAGLVAACLQAGALLTQRATLDVDELLLPNEPPRRLRRRGPLHVVAQRGLLVLMPLLLQLAEGGLGRRELRIALGDGGGEVLDHGFLGRDPGLELANLALGGENAERLRPVAAGHPPRPAEHIALEGGHRRVGEPGRRRRRVERRRQPVAGDGGGDGVRARTGDVDHAGHRLDGIRRGRGNAGRPAGGIRHHEADAAGGAAAHERDARLGIGPGRDDDVLQQIAETGFDRPLAARRHLQVVGHRAEVAHPRLFGRQQQPRRFGVAGAGRLEVAQRGQPAGQARQPLLAPAQVALEPLAVAAHGGQLGLPLGAGRADPFEGRLRLALRGVEARPLGLDLPRLDGEIRGLGVELGQGLSQLPVAGRRVLDGVLQRGGRVHGREHLAPGRLDVSLEPVQRALGLREPVLPGLQARPDLVALGAATARLLDLGLELAPGRVPPRPQGLDLARDLAERAGQRLYLPAVERQLLLAPLDREVERVGGVPAARGRALGLRELYPAALAVSLDRRHPRRRRLLDLARRLEPGAGG